MAKKRKTKAQIKQQKEFIEFAVSLLVVALVAIGMFRFGIVGAFIDNFMRVIVGQYTLPYYLLVVFIAYINFMKPRYITQGWRLWTGLSFLFITLVLLVSLTFDPNLTGMNLVGWYLKDISNIFKHPEVNAYGGLIGASFYGLLSFLVARQGVIITIVILAILSLALIVSPSKMREKAQVGSDQAKSFFEKQAEKRQLKKEAKELERMAQEAEKELEEAVSTKANFLSLEQQSPSDTTGKKSLFLNLDKDDPEIEDNQNDADIPETMIPEIREEVTLPSSNVSDLSNDEDDLRPDHFKNYRLPSVSLLDSPKGSGQSRTNVQNANAKGKRLVEVLKQFGIDSTLLEIHIGPAVTKFELKPDSNVKISKIASVQDNLMMELAVKTLRIEAPIPGKNAVGIEIPNQEMIPVKMREVIAKTPNFMDSQNVVVALGKDLMGNPVSVSLNKMPHMLVAGATGSGKSVCMNTIITSILLNKKPTELKLLLIDPKKVEFTPYSNIPHLIGPVISDPMQASMALKVIVDEMDKRYDLFSNAGVRNIGSYNAKVEQFPEENRSKLPWIVVIIDELADLMAVAGKEVETSIQRITQLARAAGIHLIVATQRPSVDVVTGIIKANIPSRIAFAVSSSVDSRTILDTVGAEKLLGYGDMLYVPMGEPNPTRVQGCYVSDEEVRKIAENATLQAKPRYEDAFIQLDGVQGNSGIVASSDDPMYLEAVEFVVREQKASTSLLQRRFKIGYNRAANLIDALQENGIIGPANGSKPREVYRKPDENE